MKLVKAGPKKPSGYKNCRDEYSDAGHESGTQTKASTAKDAEIPPITGNWRPGNG